MNLYSLNPYLRRALLSYLPEGYEIKRRVLLDYELLYIGEGQLTFTYAEAVYHCHAGDLLLICPGVPHSFEVGDVTLFQPHIHFDLVYDDVSEQVPVCFKDYPALSPAERRMMRHNEFVAIQSTPFLQCTDRERFSALFFEIVSSSQTSRPLHKKALMMELLEMLLQENFPQLLLEPKAADNAVIRQVHDYIDANFEQNFTLDDLEKQFFYSKFYIERQFCKQYGCSVMAYRVRRRMEEAKRHLHSCSVTQTALLVGYGTVYSFSRVFHRYFGISPCEYQRQNKTAVT